MMLTTVQAARCRDGGDGGGGVDAITMDLCGSLLSITLIFKKSGMPESNPL